MSISKFFTKINFFADTLVSRWFCPCELFGRQYSKNEMGTVQKSSSLLQKKGLALGQAFSIKI